MGRIESEDPLFNLKRIYTFDLCVSATISTLLFSYFRQSLESRESHGISVDLARVACRLSSIKLGKQRSSGVVAALSLNSLLPLTKARSRKSRRGQLIARFLPPLCNASVSSRRNCVRFVTFRKQEPRVTRNPLSRFERARPTANP